jgi:hypothetical protein
MKKNKIFIHINNSQELKIAEVEETTRIGLLVKEFVPQLSQDDDTIEDVEIYLENQDEDLDKGISISEAGIKHGDHIFIGRCKKIPVNINYAGKIFSVNVGPSTTIKVLKAKALEYFGIDHASGAALLLWLGKEVLDSRQFIGSLTDYPTNGVNLTLASKNDINGNLSNDIFLEHLNSAEYQSGEIEGRWGIINSENRQTWPILFFWIISTVGNKYYFKFDFTGYPQCAPTAIIWDIDEDLPLSKEKRPNSTPRQNQAFKEWGKPCNYLPCDRMAFEGHPTWPQLHPTLIWNSQKDNFLKYLNELYQILNP